MIYRMKKLQVFFGIMFLFSVVAFGENQKDWMTKRGIPKWKMGDWWIVSSDILIDEISNPSKPPRIGGAISDPKKRGIFSVSLIFRVCDTNNVAGDLCDLIEIFPYELPPGVTDDSGGKPLWRLFIRQDDGTLARNEWNLRRSPCFVTGPVDLQGSQLYKQRSPVVKYVPQLTPLVIPYLSPHSIHEHKTEYTEVKTGKKSTETFSVASKKVFEFTSENSDIKKSQSVDIIEDVVFGKRQEILNVNFVCDDDRMERTVITQTWVSGYPWWVQCSSRLMNGDLEYGTIRSRLVEFGNKGQKPTVKNILQGSVLPAPIARDK
jgi:hypothetical protein